jgi:hypothetical protein
MEFIMFRSLKASEIECRVQTVKKNGYSILLYKDARCDMNILDETVGNMFWKSEHTRNNANCVVSIWNKELNQWVSKEDTGTESFTEKEKGLASDSFKRACFNWGIGRELYTAPFISLRPLDNNEIKERNGKYAVYSKIFVSNIRIENQKITYLELKDSKGRIRFTYGSFKAKNKNKNTFRERVIKLCDNKKENFTVVSEILNGQELDSITDKKEQEDFLTVLGKRLSGIN